MNQQVDAALTQITDKIYNFAVQYAEIMLECVAIEVTDESKLKVFGKLFSGLVAPGKFGNVSSIGVKTFYCNTHVDFAISAKLEKEENIKISKQLKSQMGSLAKNLHLTISFLDTNPLLRDYMAVHFFQDERIDGPNTEEVEQFIRYLKDVRRKADYYAAAITKPRPLSNLEGYVLTIAELYQELTQEAFTVYRDKEVKSAISKGHIFVSHAVEYLNEILKLHQSEILYTESNIYNACETARSLIRTPRTRVRRKKKTRNDKIEVIPNYSSQ